MEMKCSLIRNSLVIFNFKNSTYSHLMERILQNIIFSMGLFKSRWFFIIQILIKFHEKVEFTCSSSLRSCDYLLVHFMWAVPLPSFH